MFPTIRNTTVPRFLWDSPRAPFLIKALYTEDIEKVQILLNVLPCTLVNITDNLQRTPLHLAVDIGNPEILHLLLLQNLINIEARDFEDCTVFHRAIEKHSLQLVHVLLYHGADVNARCRKFFGQTPFLICLKTNCDHIGMALLDFVVDFNEKDESGNSALYYAMKNGSVLIREIIKRRDNAPVQASELLLSLCYKDNSMFQYCRVRTNYELIATRMFSVLLSEACQFSNRKWLKSVMELLQSLNQNDSLCKKCYIYKRQNMFRNLLETLSRRNIYIKYRYQLVYAFLSYGTQLNGLNNYNFHNYYLFTDKKQMLHVLVQAGYNVDNYFQKINGTSNPLTIQLYLKYTKLSLNYILEKFMLINMNMSDVQVKVIQILSNLCTPNMKNKRLYNIFRQECMYEAFEMQNENVPKLLELSRDKVRTLIGVKYKTSCFCCILKYVNLPKEVKNLLLFDRPIFRECLHVVKDL